MEILVPDVQYRKAGVARLATRPRTLDGLRIGLSDGWGIQHDDGTVGIYPLMAAWAERLKREFDVGDVVWEQKPGVSEPMPTETLDVFLRTVDLVINGEAA